jgi:outer membrane protein assembly factor BamB
MTLASDWRLRRRAVFLALAASGLIGRAAPASDWARWRGPEGNGISAEKDWQPQAIALAKIAWKTNLGVGHSNVAVAGSRLFTMGNVRDNDIVYAFDASSGKELWRHSYPCSAGNYDGTRATPVLDGELLYTMSREGHVLCLEAATGKVKWQKNLIKDYGAQDIQWGLSGSPLVLGKIVVYNARASGIALDKLTGEKVWETAEGLCGYSAPVHFMYKGKDCVALFGCKQVSVVDAQTGAKLYSHPWETQYDVNVSDPIYFDGKLFITSGYGRGCALLDLSGDDAKVLWENQNMRSHFATPVYLDGHLYGVDGNTGGGQLRCLEVATGKVKWSQKGRYENMMVVSGRILAIDSKGELSVAEANPEAFKEIARGSVLNGKATNWTAPVLANGLVYCRNSKGDLVCVEAK